MQWVGGGRTAAHLQEGPKVRRGSQWGRQAGWGEVRRWGCFPGCRVATAGAVYGGSGVAQGQGQPQRTGGNSSQIVFTRLVKTVSVETLELPAVVAELESTAWPLISTAKGKLDTLMTGGLWPHLSSAHTAARPLGEAWRMCFRFFFFLIHFFIFQTKLNRSILAAVQLRSTGRRFGEQRYILLKKNLGQKKKKKTNKKNKIKFGWEFLRPVGLWLQHTTSQPESSHESVRIHTCPQA